MFTPPLDLGLDWEPVDKFSVEPERFNYQHYSDLSFRSDALLVNVSISIPGIEYKYAGEIFQYWEVAANRYQTRYSRVYLNQQTVVAIEPLLSSRLLFRPATYLYNWNIDIKARPYILPNSKEIDLSQVTSQLEVISDKITTEFKSNRTDLGEIAANNVEERLKILTQLKEVDAGIYNLADGLADLLPGDRGAEIKQTAQNRLNLNLGFL